MCNVDFHERSRKLQRRENRSGEYLAENVDVDLVDIDGWPSWALNAAFRRADSHGPRGWSPGGVVAVLMVLAARAALCFDLGPPL